MESKKQCHSEKIMLKNFLRLEKETNFGMQDAEWSSNWINLKKFRAKYSIIKVEKVKDIGKILKAARGEYNSYPVGE